MWRDLVWLKEEVAVATWSRPEVVAVGKAVVAARLFRKTIGERSAPRSRERWTSDTGSELEKYKLQFWFIKKIMERVVI